MSSYRSYTPTEEDAHFIQMAVKYRRQMIPPSQSNFRVVAVFTYKEIEAPAIASNTSNQSLNLSNATFKDSQYVKYVIGCNGLCF